ncbi:MAG: hypothetical protein H7Y33_14005 [Cytophagales bacterium]|nr:hypothetical protein [Rhizobacter sp.]
MVVDYTGLVFKYPVNRRLTEGEWRGQLKQTEQLELVPLAHLWTIRLNSTYLEMVGKFYDWKGWATLVLSIAAGGILWFLSGLVWVVSTRPEGYADRAGDMCLIVGMGVLAAPIVAFAVWGLTREVFRLTHYPIRLNRKTRKLYAIDPKTLEVIEADWDKMVFTLQPCLRLHWLKQHEILGHVMADDGSTVLKTVPFSMVWDVKEHLMRHWEYMRRYMEVGPEAVFDHTPVCLPIAEHKETYVFGLQFLIMNATGHSLMMTLSLPLELLSSIGRYIAIQTSRTPTWPACVDAECALEAGDPYAIDSKNNPAKFWSNASKRRSELVQLGLVGR